VKGLALYVGFTLYSEVLGFLVFLIGVAVAVFIEKTIALLEI
jgi:hypothetical protein